MALVTSPLARIACLGLLLAGVFALQVHWLADLEQARLTEQRRLLTGAVDRLALDLDDIVARIGESVMLDWPERLAADDATLIVDAVAEPRPMSPVESGITVTAGPTLHVTRLDGSTLRVLLDRERLATTAIPALARRAFGPDLFEDVVISVHSTSDSADILYRSHDASIDGHDVDAHSPTLRPPSRGFALFSEEGSSWTPLDVEIAEVPGASGASSSPSAFEVTAHHRAGSLANALANQRGRELALAAVVLSLLALAVISVWRAEVRARRLAESELTFVASVSHELRTPLAALRLSASNLERGVISNPVDTASYGALIERQVARMTALVDRTLRFAGRREMRAHETVDLGALLARACEVANVWKTRRRVEIVIELEARNLRVIGDADALLSAVENLLDNAIKYGPDGQTIRVKADAVRGAVRVSVTDEGPGIPRTQRARVMRPFQRGDAHREPGSGLGLAVVARVVHDHRGTLELESTPTGGTRAVLTVASQ